MAGEHKWLFESERKKPNIHNQYCLNVRRGDFEQAELARTRISKWFEDWDDHSDAHLLQGLNSPLDEQFISSVWELYVNTLLKRLGFEVTRLKQASSGTNPDFRVAGNGSTFFVEASAIYKETSAADKIWTQIRHNLSTIVSTTLGFAIRPEKMSATAPKSSDLRNRIIKFLGSVQDPKNITLTNSPEDSIELGEWSFRVNAWPHPQPDIESKAMLLTGMGEAGLVTDQQDLKAKLKTKSGHYKNLEHPLLLAILENSFVAGTDNWHRMGALFGSEAIRIPKDGIGEAESFRQADGFWDLNKGNRKVSAILLTGRLEVQWDQLPLPSVWINPIGEREITSSPLDRLRSYKVNGFEVEETSGDFEWDGL